MLCQKHIFSSIFVSFIPVSKIAIILSSLMVYDLSLSNCWAIIGGIWEIEDVITLSISIIKSAGWSTAHLWLIVASVIFNFNHAANWWMQLVHTLDLGSSFLWYIDWAQMSLLCFNVQVIQLSGLWLFNFVSHSKMILSSLLWRDNLCAVHVNLVNSVIELISINHKWC